MKLQNQKLNFDSYRIKIFSIGAQNENHGKALPKSIDDFIARHLAVNLSEEINGDYLGHLPYCGDREGKKAKDWNPGVMERKTVVKGIISDIKKEISKRRKLHLPPSVCIVLVSGHGGNNYLLEEQERIWKETKIPFLYIPPFDKVRIKHKRFGRLEMTHADHAEHAVAEYLGLIKKKNLQKINNLARKNPLKALKEDPAIMGLGGYVLPEIAGDKYKSLRDRHPELVKMARDFIKKDKKIIVDKKDGELLIKTAIKNAKKTINSFLKKNNLF